MTSSQEKHDAKRQAWLKERRKGIGASEASAILGANPYMTNVELWEIKTGRRVPEDISDKPYVKYGLEAEKHLRSLFALNYPEYKVSHKEFEIIRSLQYPFIFATLDGKLQHKETGAKGILEIKTTEILSSMARESWKERVPDNYYIQCLHQILATGWEYNILMAQLKYIYGNCDVRLITRHYRWTKEEVTADLNFLLDREIDFWTNFVLPDKRPPLILPNI